MTSEKTSSGNDGASFGTKTLDPKFTLQPFMTPISHKISPTTSPPALCSDKKHAKRDFPFQDKQAISKLQIFDFSDDDISEDNDIGDDSKYYSNDLKRRKPLKFRLVQRRSRHVAMNKEGNNPSSPCLSFTNQAPILTPRFISSPQLYSNQIDGSHSQHHISNVLFPQPKHFKRQFSASTVTP